LIGIWFGKREPDIKIMFAPFISDAKVAATNGISLPGGVIKKVFPLLAIADSMARPKLQNMTFNKGFFGCAWCLHPNDEIGQNYNR